MFNMKFSTSFRLTSIYVHFSILIEVMLAITQSYPILVRSCVSSVLPFFMKWPPKVDTRGGWHSFSERVGSTGENIVLRLGFAGRSISICSAPAQGKFQSFISPLEDRDI